MKKLTFTIALSCLFRLFSFGQCDTFLGITPTKELCWIKTSGEYGVIDKIEGINAIATNDDLGILYSSEGQTIYWYDLKNNTKGNLGTFEITGSLSSGGATYNNGFLYLATEDNDTPRDIYRIEVSADGKGFINNTLSNITNGNGPDSSGYGDIIVEGSVDNETIYGSTRSPNFELFFWKFDVKTKVLTSISTSTNTYALQLAKDDYGNIWAYDYGNGNIFQLDKTTGESYNTVYVLENKFNDLGGFTCNFNDPTTSLTSLSTNTERLNIYPNPFFDTLNFEINGTSKITSICIYNSVGVRLMEFNNKTTVDLSNLCKGLYFAEVVFNDNVRTTKTLIKK